MASPERVAGVFDRAADTYEHVGVPWFGPIAAGLVDELAVQPGERVIDIGCGRGAALFPLAAAAGPAGTVLGIDLAPRMVQLTAQDAADLPQVRVQVADASDPGLPPASFDVVSSSLVLFFLPDPAAALRVWVDLLADGGRLGISTMGRQDPAWQRIDAILLQHLPPAMLDARTSGRRGPFGSDEGVEQLLRDAGLTDVRTVSRTVHAVLRDAEHLVEFSWSHGQRAMWEAIPPAQHDELRRQIIDAVNQLDNDGRPLSFSQEIRYTLGRKRGPSD